MSTQNAPAGGKALCRVRYGGYNNAAPFVGMTVEAARAKLATQWSVPGDAAAYIGKTELASDYVIQANDEIEFVKRQGEKG